MDVWMYAGESGAACVYNICHTTEKLGNGLGAVPIL